MNQKSIIVASVVMAIIFVGAIIYFAITNRFSQPVIPTSVTQQPVINQQTSQSVYNNLPVDETANWQTYTSTKYGFDLRYPNGYKYIENNDYGVEPDFVIRKVSDDRGVYAFGVGVVTNFLGGDPDKFKDPEEWEKEQNKLGDTFTKSTVDGRVAYTTLTYNPQNFQGEYKKYMVFIKNGSVYDMYQIFTEKNDPIGEKIISTFKFTK